MIKNADHPLLVSACLLCLTAGLVCIAYQCCFQMAWKYEFSHYGDIARQLVHGYGFTTNFVEPMKLAYLHERHLSAPPWPVVYRFHLFAMLIASGFAVLGISDIVIIAVTGIIFACFVVAIYLLGRQLAVHSPFSAAILAALTPLFWKCFVLWGYTCFIFALLILVHYYYLSACLASDKQRPLHFWLLGLLGAATYFVRSNVILFLPVILLVIYYHSRQKSINLGGYLGAFLSITLPFVIYRHFAFGEVTSISALSNFADLIQNRDLPWLNYDTAISPLQLVMQYPEKVFYKGLNLFGLHVKWFGWQFGYSLLIPFAIGNCIFLYQRKFPVHKIIFVQLYLGALITQMLIFSFLRVETWGRYFVWFAPFTLLMGIDFFVAVVQTKWHHRRHSVYALASGVWLLCLLYQLNYSLPQKYKAWPEKNPKREEFKELSKIIPENNALTISNVGVHLAWYLKRSCIDLPNTMEDLHRIIDEHRHVRFIYFAWWPQGELYNRPFWYKYLQNPAWFKQLQQQIPAIFLIYQTRDSALLGIRP